MKYNPAQLDNAVLETEVAGFLYKQQVLRLAKVVVNKHPEPKKEALPEAPVLPPPSVMPELPPDLPAAETPKKRKDKSKRKSMRKKKKKR